jgi:hypothetical protein
VEEALLKRGQKNLRKKNFMNEKLKVVPFFASKKCKPDNP